MFFWGAQIFIALLGVGLSAYDFRIGVVVWFTLLVQAVALFAMLTPSNQILLPLLLFVPLALAVGLVLEIGGNRLPWWLLGSAATATLLLVRISLELEAWVAGTWSSGPFFILVWNSLIIATALFAGLCAARGLSAVFRHIGRKRVPIDS